MNKIKNEMKLLLEMAATGELPGYEAPTESSSFYAEKTDCEGLREYYSGENDALELRLNALWAQNEQMQTVIPLVLAAVEKSRGQEGHALVHTELYNYTM